MMKLSHLISRRSEDECTVTSLYLAKYVLPVIQHHGSGELNCVAVIVLFVFVLGGGMTNLLKLCIVPLRAFEKNDNTLCSPISATSVKVLLSQVTC